MRSFGWTNAHQQWPVFIVRNWVLRPVQEVRAAAAWNWELLMMRWAIAIMAGAAAFAVTDYTLRNARIDALHARQFEEARA